jgi:hypothetical protein
MSGKWTKIIEQAGDESIGAALTRLAQAAAGVHMFQSTRAAQGERRAGGTGDDSSLPGVLGLRMDVTEGRR